MGMSPAFLIGSEEYGGASVRLEIEKASREITRIREHVHRPRLNKISYVTIMDLVSRGELPAHPRGRKAAAVLNRLPELQHGRLERMRAVEHSMAFAEQRGEQSTNHVQIPLP